MNALDGREKFFNCYRVRWPGAELLSWELNSTFILKYVLVSMISLETLNLEVIKFL